MTTVGYGDMFGITTLEQIYCVVLMMAGIFFFSMINSSLASIISSLDSENAESNEKMLFLNRLNFQYNLPKFLNKEINKVLLYDM